MIVFLYKQFCRVENIPILSVRVGKFDTVKIEGKFKQSELYKTCLVVQWLRICLPVQGTRVQALVWEDLTCSQGTKPVRHNY